MVRFIIRWKKNSFIDALEEWTEQRKKADIGKQLFAATIILAAFSIAANQVAEDTNWKDWAFQLSFETLRAALILSNVRLRQISLTAWKVCISMSVVVTVVIGLHYGSTTLLWSGDFWKLQGINLLMIFAEWSVSILIGGQMINWKSFLDHLGDKSQHFDWSTVPAELEAILRTIVNGIRKDQERIDGQHKEILAMQKKQEAERAAQAILIGIGERLSNKRVSIGNNEYLLFCAGKEGQEEGCEPIRINKSQTKVVCDNCGRIHTKESMTLRYEKV
jgi:hypothetical protein